MFRVFYTNDKGTVTTTDVSAIQLSINYNEIHKSFFHCRVKYICNMYAFLKAVPTESESTTGKY